MIIAISGLSGCGNTTVTAALARHGFKKINYTFRDLAAEKGLNLKKLQELAKKNSAIDLELDRKQVALLAKEKNAVIGSRLAIWLDSPKVTRKLGVKPPKIDLKVWLDASLETRAARTKKAKPNESKAFTAKRDRENAARYKKTYGISVQEHDFVDLKINTEKFDAESVAAIIAFAARHCKK
ncbi:MAG: (d)CMP kinase [Candidatus Micrarchaeia archaeon]|jgi:cytidylate kinase